MLYRKDKRQLSVVKKEIKRTLLPVTSVLAGVLLNEVIRVNCV